MRNRKILCLIMLPLVLAACGSSPSWDGYSPTEATNLQSMSISAQDAKIYREMGFTSATIQTWYDQGINLQANISAWHDGGFTAQDAGIWHKAGFSLKNAYEWRQENFNVRDAKKYVDQGKNLKNAKKMRKEGIPLI